MWFYWTYFKNTTCFATCKNYEKFILNHVNHLVKVLTLKWSFKLCNKNWCEKVTHVDTSSFVLKANLANLKTEVDKLDIDKLVHFPTDLSKLSNFVKNDVAKKTVYDQLVGDVNEIPLNNIDTRDFVLKTKYNTDKRELENKIPNLTDFIKKAKFTELENKILNISNLATKTALTTVENKIPNISNLATKAALTTVENKIPDISNLATK